MMPILHAILGTIVLFFGRTLFWVFVAVAGFLVGGQLAESALAGQDPWVRLLAALAAGAIGALLAMLLQRVAFALGGFFAGGYLVLLVAPSIQTDGSSPLPWFLIGGVIGAILAAMIMDWAIIVLSSLVGAGAVVSALPLEPGIAAITYLLLVIVGIVVQGNRFQRTRDVRTTAG